MLLIDPPTWPAHGRRWSHLVSDASLAELHAFAHGLGIPVRGFEGDHYDIPEERYAAVVAAGAVPVSGRELLRRLRASGLRRPKRRGERVLASTWDDTGCRVDVVLSALDPLGRAVRTHLVLRHGTAVLVLVEHDGEAYALPAAGAQEPTDAVVAALVGDAPPLHRIGYLRPEGRGVVEPVLLGRPASRPDPAAGLRWADTVEAGGLLPRHLAPFVHGPFAV